MLYLYTTVFAYAHSLRQGAREHAAYNAFWTVPAWILLALGGTVYLGALAFCMIRGQNLETVIDLDNGRFLIGCR